MEVNICANLADSRFVSGGILAAGDSPNFPLTVPQAGDISSLQVKKIVAPLTPVKLFYNCNRENN
jgi:hypothetical protein